MANGQSEYIPVIKVSDFKVGAPPMDVSETVGETHSEADERILARVETGNGPRFYSIARTCTHQGCNILLGGPQWAIVDKPITFFLVGDDGAARAVIQCPCHGSRFDLLSGERLRGPAPPGRLNSFGTKIDQVNGEDFVFVSVDPVDPASG